VSNTNVCPRCGKEFSHSSAVHISCIFARVWQVFKIVISLIVFFLIVFAILWLVQRIPRSTAQLDSVVLSPHFATNTLNANLAKTWPIQPPPTNTARPIATRLIQPPSTNTPRPTQQRLRNATVNTDRLNIRRGPGPEYEVVTAVSRGDRLSLVGRNSDGTWAQINTSDARWVNVSLLQINGSLLSLPITY
jgi:uncharacterized protein YgiM (DUF1202 family)